MQTHYKLTLKLPMTVQLPLMMMQIPARACCGSAPPPPGAGGAYAG